MASVTIDGLSARDTGFLADIRQLAAGWPEPLTDAHIGLAVIGLLAAKWRRTPSAPLGSRGPRHFPESRQAFVNFVRSNGTNRGSGQVQVDNISPLDEGNLAEMRALAPAGGAALTDAEIGRAAIRELTTEWGRSPLDCATSTMRKVGTRTRREIVEQLADLRS